LLQGATDLYSISNLIAFFVYWFINVIFLFLSSNFANSTPYLSTSQMASWNVHYYFLTMFISTVIGIWSMFTKNFDQWVGLVMIGINIFFHIFQYCKYTTLPFLHEKTNIWFLSFFCATISSDLYYIICFASEHVNADVFSIIFYGPPFFFYFPNQFFIHFIKKI
jgi:hypothetical protein